MVRVQHLSLHNMLILTVYSWHVSHTNLLNVLAHNEFLCSSVVEEHPPIRLSHGLEMMPSLGSWHVSFVPYSFPDMFYLSLTPFLTCFICALLLSWHVSFVPYSFPDMFYLCLTPDIPDIPDILFSILAHTLSPFHPKATNRRWKNWVRNLQYGPRPWLIKVNIAASQLILQTTETIQRRQK